MTSRSRLSRTPYRSDDTRDQSGPLPAREAGPPGGRASDRARARLALVYGALGLVPISGFFLAILAIAVGAGSQRTSRRSGHRPFASARIGVSLGVVGATLSAALFVLFVTMHLR